MFQICSKLPKSLSHGYWFKLTVETCRTIGFTCEWFYESTTHAEAGPSAILLIHVQSKCRYFVNELWETLDFTSLSVWHVFCTKNGTCQENLNDKFSVCISHGANLVRVIAFWTTDPVQANCEQKLPFSGMKSFRSNFQVFVEASKSMLANQIRFP